MQYKREGFCLSYGQRREKEAHGWMVVQEPGAARLNLSLYPLLTPHPSKSHQACGESQEPAHFTRGSLRLMRRRCGEWLEYLEN